MGRKFVKRLVIQMFFLGKAPEGVSIPPPGTRESLDGILGTGSFGWHGDWDFDVLIYLISGDEALSRGWVSTKTFTGGH